MTEAGNPGLVIELEGDDPARFDKVLSYSISSSFFIPTDGWNVTVYDEDAASLVRLFRPLRPVSLHLNGNLQVIGRIDSTVGSSNGSAVLNVTGRDHLASVVAANIDPSVNVKSGMSLAQALIEGLRVFGITEVEATDAAVTARKAGLRSSKVAAGSPNAVTVGEVKPKDGQGAFAWADMLAARSGFTIQPGTKRSSIAVTKPDFTASPTYALSRPGNVQEATASRDYGDVPTVVVVNGRVVTKQSGIQKSVTKEYSLSGDGSPSALRLLPEGQLILNDDVLESRVPKESTILPGAHYVPIYVQDTESRTEEQLDKAAKRTLADYMRKTLEYTCTVQGHTDPVSGALWTVNTLARVDDDVADVHETLWLVETEHTYTEGQGQQTRLTLIRPASWSI